MRRRETDDGAADGPVEFSRSFITHEKQRMFHAIDLARKQDVRRTSLRVFGKHVRSLAAVLVEVVDCTVKPYAGRRQEPKASVLDDGIGDGVPGNNDLHVRRRV